jgi:hypothetical protein
MVGLTFIEDFPNAARSENFPHSISPSPMVGNSTGGSYAIESGVMLHTNSLPPDLHVTGLEVSKSSSFFLSHS